MEGSGRKERKGGRGEVAEVDALVRRTSQRRQRGQAQLQCSRAQQRYNEEQSLPAPLTSVLASAVSQMSVR